jgi:hypothetical protein
MTPHPSRIKTSTGNAQAERNNTESGSMATAKRTATAPVHLWCQVWIPAPRFRGNDG